MIQVHWLEMGREHPNSKPCKHQAGSSDPRQQTNQETNIPASFWDRRVINMPNTTEHRRIKDKEHRKSGEKDEYRKYTPLLKAALKGDWETANEFFDQYPNSIRAPITRELETALYMATGTGAAAINFVTKLLEKLGPKDLAKQDIAGNTPLHLAVWVGNTEAAKLLVKEYPRLLCITERRKWLPVHYAAINAKKETLLFLLEATEEDADAKRMLFRSSESDGIELLLQVITSGFHDIALDLVHRYPQLALSSSPYDKNCGLGAIARQAHAFRSGMHMNFWERIIYNYVPVKLKKYAKDPISVEVENPANNFQPVQKYHWTPFLVSQKLHAMLWKVCALLVPHVKHIQVQKQMHHQARQLVKYLVNEMLVLNDLNDYESLAEDAIVHAAKLGIHEVVEEIVQSVPKLAWTLDSENRILFERAVIERHENIFNLIYQMSDHKHSATMNIDEDGNTILHLAGRLAPQNKLNLVSGAALQMQRELQWFMEVKKFVRPSYIESQNKHKETPAMVFAKEHEDLVVEGGKWLKRNATSCTITAVLIATVVFAAIITIPGGIDTNGIPNFSKNGAFIVFIILDALSLFTSITSLLLFLSILTSRCAEDDFLYVLPKMLILGKLALFISITTMMGAFCVFLYLVLGHKESWIYVIVAALACIPVTTFVFLQFPLLVDLISSTYGRGIFGKRSDRQFF